MSSPESTLEYELSPIVHGDTRAASPAAVASISSHPLPALSAANAHPPHEQVTTEGDPSPVYETSPVAGSIDGVPIAERSLEGFYNSPTPSLHNEILPAYTPQHLEYERHSLSRNWWALLWAMAFVALMLYEWIVGIACL
jgi:hypothetical protein